MNKLYQLLILNHNKAKLIFPLALTHTRFCRGGAFCFDDLVLIHSHPVNSSPFSQSPLRKTPFATQTILDHLPVAIALCISFPYSNYFYACVMMGYMDKVCLFFTSSTLNGHFKLM